MSSQVVQLVLDKYSMFTLIEKDRLAERRVQFIPHIIEALHNPKWGYLIKTGGKVQDDIVVDKTTMHHYDCLTAVDEGGKYRIKAVWKDQGIVPDKWKWGAIGAYEVKPFIEDQYPDFPDDNPEDNPIEISEKLDRIMTDIGRILRLLEKVFK